MGEIILCGAVLEPDAYARLADIALTDAGVKTYKTDGELTVAVRRGDGRSGLVICECQNEPAWIELEASMTDILTDKTYHAGKMEIEPYGVYVLEKN